VERLPLDVEAGRPVVGVELESAIRAVLVAHHGELHRSARDPLDPAAVAGGQLLQRFLLVPRLLVPRVEDVVRHAVDARMHERRPVGVEERVAEDRPAVDRRLRRLLPEAQEVLRRQVLGADHPRTVAARHVLCLALDASATDNG
jgi:hypothetical protein